VIQVNGVAEVTTYVSATQVTAAIPAAQLTSGGQFTVVAANGSQSSTPGTTTSLQVTNPSPTITTVAPASVPVSPNLPVVAVVGTGFVPTTTVQVNGSARATAYASASQVNVTLNATDVAATGSLSLVAVNGAPGGGTSTAATVGVVNPMPAVTAVNPRTVLTGSGSNTITITGTNFVPNTTVLLNGVAQGTTYISATQVSFSMPAQTNTSSNTLAVSNPTPGGGSFAAGYMYVVAPTSTPVIASITPTQIVAGSSATTVAVTGTNFGQQIGTNSYLLTSQVYWNGTALTPSGYLSNGVWLLNVSVPASLLTTTGKATVTVQSTASSTASNAVTVSIIDPPAPTLTTLTPSAVPLNTSSQITLTGTNFYPKSTVALNGVTIPSTYVSSTQITATVPGINLPGNAKLTVTTPSPGGGTAAALPLTSYIDQASNDIVYRATDGLIYASVPASSAKYPNSVVAVDPLTGSVLKQIQVGSNPNKLALSSDGTKLWVGLDGANSVSEIDLTSGTVVLTFSLMGTPGYYATSTTALALAAMPGTPNSVAVLSPLGNSSAAVRVFDSGIVRTKNSTSVCTGTGGLTFGSSASTLYLASYSSLCTMNVGSTGITSGTTLPINSYTSVSRAQYDNGLLYLSNGQVYNTTGALAGTFYVSSTTAANGPIVSDSTLGIAAIAEYISSTYTNQIQLFNETSYVPVGTIPLGLPTGASYYSTPSLLNVVRWGQNGLAVNTSKLIYSFQSSQVKDLSSTPADVSIQVTGPSTATTGSSLDYAVKVSNLGPSTAQGVTASIVLDSSLIVTNVMPSQGTCGTGSVVTCNFGTIASGSSAVIAVSATPQTAGTVTMAVSAASVSVDSTLTNNAATTSTTVTGSQFNAVPVVKNISPRMVKAGAADFTLTVNGSGFNSGSTVNLNGTALTTTYVSATQLTAAVTASQVASFGWAAVTVKNPIPGGGTSATLPLTIYTVVDLATNGTVYDPFGQKIYGTIPSSVTTITGNSVEAIDPAKATIGTPVAVGSEPGPIALTSSGNYLWVGLNGAKSLVQVDLQQQKALTTYPLTAASYSGSASVTATSLATIPTLDNTLAIYAEGANQSYGFGVYDTNGTSGAFRTNFSGYTGGNAVPLLLDSTRAAAFSYGSLYRFTLDANGVTLQDSNNVTGSGTGVNAVAYGVLYSASGSIWNMGATTPALMASLLLPDDFGLGSSPNGQVAVPDMGLQKEFLVLSNTDGNSSTLGSIVRFDMNRYLAEDFVPITLSGTSSATVTNAMRWGQDGLALQMKMYNNSTNATDSKIMLLRGPFVTPQLISSGVSAATLSTPGSLSHGAGNTQLVLTGTNFQPGVAITWNGSYRTTTWFSNTQVYVYVSASDLAAAGTVNLVATNPGAAASNTVSLTIN